MPDHSQSSPVPPARAEMAELLDRLRPPWPLPVTGRAAPGLRAQELGLDEVLHCREQALYCASMMAPDLSVFEDDDAGVAARTVLLAQRFEVYIRTGE